MFEHVLCSRHSAPVITRLDWAIHKNFDPSPQDKLHEKFFYRICYKSYAARASTSRLTFSSFRRNPSLPRKNPQRLHLATNPKVQIPPTPPKYPKNPPPKPSPPLHSRPSLSPRLKVAVTQDRPSFLSLSRDKVFGLIFSTKQRGLSKQFQKPQSTPT